MAPARLLLMVFAVGCVFLDVRFFPGSLKWSRYRKTGQFVAESHQPRSAEKQKVNGQLEATPHHTNKCRSDQLVYTYDLPPQFNTGLVDDDCGKGWKAHPRDACVVYSLEHWGIGPPLQDEAFSNLGSDPQLWAETGQHALEVMVHQYLTRLYPCRTSNPEAAAAFYVPLFTGRLWHVHSSYECGRKTCVEPSTMLRLSLALDESLGRVPYVRR